MTLRRMKGIQKATPLAKLNLADSVTMVSFATKVPNADCPHGNATHHRCHACVQQKISDVLTYETFFAISANQILTQPMPKTVEFENQRQYRCTNFEEVRRYPKFHQLTPEQVTEAQTLLGKGEILVFTEHDKTILQLEAKAITAAIEEANTSNPTLLADVTKVYEGRLDYVTRLEHQRFFTNMVSYFQWKRSDFEALAFKHGLPLNVVTDYVMPQALGLQAKKHLEATTQELVRLHPPLKKLFFSGATVFREAKSNSVKFYDGLFPNYSVYRVGNPGNTLCSMASPAEESWIPPMFADTLFNANYRINESVVLGDLPGVNYFLHHLGKTLVFENNPGSKTGPRVEITVKEVEGVPVDRMMAPLDEKWAPQDARSITVTLIVKAINFPQNATQEPIQKPIEELKVHFFKMTKGWLNVDHPKDLERLANLCQRSTKTRIGFHSAEVSDTFEGMPDVVIFAFELGQYLLQNASTIDSSNIHKCFLQVLDNIRSHNPTFIKTKHDYLEGIRLAGLLYSKLAPKLVLDVSKSESQSTTRRVLTVCTTGLSNSDPTFQRELENDLQEALSATVLEAATPNSKEVKKAHKRPSPLNKAMSPGQSVPHKELDTPRPLVRTQSGRQLHASQELRLSGSIPQVDHRDYAGFIPKDDGLGRKLYDERGPALRYLSASQEMHPNAPSTHLPKPSGSPCNVPQGTQQQTQLGQTPQLGKGS